MVCLLAAVIFLFNPSQSLALPSVSLSNLQQVLPSYLQSHHHGWWDQGSNIPDYCSKDRWNILYHLGGNGPWIEKVDGVTKGGINVPEGCEVDMVHMVHPISHIPMYSVPRTRIKLLAFRCPVMPNDIPPRV
jgi:acid phosphatase